MSYWLRMDSDPPDHLCREGYVPGVIWFAALALGSLAGAGLAWGIGA